MSFLCYDDQPQRRSKGGPPLDAIDPIKGYLTHYANSLYLQFMLLHGTMLEKHQASKELTICERKMKWHEHHPSFDWPLVLLGIDKLKKQWSK